MARTFTRQEFYELVWSKPMYSNIAFWRFVEPFGQHTWTTITVAKLAPVDPHTQPDDDNKWKKIDLREKDRVAIEGYSHLAGVPGGSLRRFRNHPRGGKAGIDRTTHIFLVR